MIHQVVHILGSAQLEAAAPARLVGTLARGLDPDKYALHAWFLDGGGPLTQELREAGVSVRVVPWSRKTGDPKGALNFAQALRRSRFSIVHQHSGGRLTTWIARRASKAPIVCHFHSRVLEANGVEPATFRAPEADVVIAVSRAVARSIEGAVAQVVPVGVWVANNGAIAAVGGDGAHVIGTACRLAPVKGLKYLLRAAALLSGEFPNLRLEIAGVGTELDALKADAETLGIAGRVNFIGWHPHLHSLFAGWQIFVLPSLDEGCPVSVLEAMASGLPIVASEAGGLPEIVVEGVTGHLVPPADPHTLARRLRTLLRNPQLRRAMGQAGRERVERCFSAQSMTSKISAIYDEIVANRALRL